jgi:hypothetical protein
VRVVERLNATRIVATPSAIDKAEWPQEALVFRLAPDEVLVTASVPAGVMDDAHAILERETGFSAVWVDHTEAMDFLERECDWELPGERPAFAQGMVAGLPLKLWFEQDRVLLLVASPYAADLAERLR